MLGYHKPRCLTGYYTRRRAPGFLSGISRNKQTLRETSEIAKSRA